MSDKILFEVSIRTRDNDEKFCLGNDIHEMLVGHPDYINSNIALNIDGGNTVKLIVYEGCNEIPEITTYGDILAVRFNGKEAFIFRKGE